MLKIKYRTRHQHCGFLGGSQTSGVCTRLQDTAGRECQEKNDGACNSIRSEIENLQIHKAVQGRKGDEARAGESPVAATGMMILERSEPW
jgi:hypothetical protein